MQDLFFLGKPNQTIGVWCRLQTKQRSQHICMGGENDRRTDGTVGGRNPSVRLRREALARIARNIDRLNVSDKMLRKLSDETAARYSRRKLPAKLRSNRQHGVSNYSRQFSGQLGGGFLGHFLIRAVFC